MERLKPRLKHMISRYRLVRGRKKLVKKVRVIKKGLLKKFDRWRYKLSNLLPFRSFLVVLRRFQKRWRFRKVLRLARKFQYDRRRFKEAWSLVVSRLRFKKIISRITFAQKTIRFFRFLRLIRFAKAIKAILWEHYDNVVWPEILTKIHLRSILKMQRNVRGHLVRVRYSEERQHMKVFKMNLYLTKAAICIQKVYKGWILRRKLNKLIKAAVVIQKNARAYLRRKWFLKLRNATLVIQKHYKRFITRKHERLALERQLTGDIEARMEVVKTVEREIFEGMNYCEDMLLKDRRTKYSHKNPPDITYMDSSHHPNTREDSLQSKRREASTL
jgi:hypothetical protein